MKSHEVLKQAFEKSSPKAIASDLGVSQAALDNSITPDEAADIRQCWDKLKSFAEGFVRCCEEGDFELMNQEEDTDSSKPRTSLY